MMDDQYANSLATQPSTDDGLRKLLKRERRLLERLQEAQDAEARSLQRFVRAQGKLQRRTAKVVRLERQVRDLRKELTLWQQVEPQEEQVANGANGHAFLPVADQQPDLFSSEYVDTPSALIEEARDAVDITPASEAVDVVVVEAPLIETVTPASERDEFEPEVHMTPVVYPESGPETPFAIEQQEAGDLPFDLPPVEPAINDEEAAPQLEQAGPQDEISASIEAAPDEQAGEVGNGSTSAQEPEALPVAEAEQAAPVLESLASEQTPADDYAAAEVARPVDLVEEAAPISESQPVEDVPVAAPEEVAPAGEQVISLPEPEPVLADAPERASVTEGVPSQPAVAETNSMQRLAQIREAWREAEYASQRARSHAHELATSISTLAQAGLSETSMEELLRKQSEANKTLFEAQKRARAAYEVLVQAEEIYRAAQPEASNGFNVHSDEVLETTVHTPAFEV